MNTKKNHYLFSLYFISESRTFLMGLAIINVMVAHSCSWMHISLDSFFSTLWSSVFTGTFMFLSGFGIFYSLTKDNQIYGYLKRRFYRLVVPFLMMVTPFYLFKLILGKLSFLDFLLYETTIYNFIYMNNGMWYIAATLLMYLCAPFIYKLMGASILRALSVGGLICAFFISLSLLIHVSFPDYSARTSILWDKLAIFIVGMIFAFLTIHEKEMLSRKKASKAGGIILFITIFLFVFLCVMRHEDQIVYDYYKQVKELLTLMLLAFMLHYTRIIKMINSIDKLVSLFGKYSLELYVMHMLFIGFVKTIMYDICLFRADIDNDRYLVYITLFLSITLCAPIHKLTSKKHNNS